MSSYNPPAFPRPGFDQPAGMEDGMSLKDWFAGQALAGIVANNNAVTASTAASWSYDFASAMLAERKRR